MKTLVVGCDASGKSTFLDLVKETYGDVVGESSKSIEASAFKAASIECLIDEAYIARREYLYLKLSHDALCSMKSLIEAGTAVVTSDASLVTRLSHNAMRSTISLPALSEVEIVERWKQDEAQAKVAAPDITVLLHAPMNVIRERIVSRQRNGDQTEAFWGFNSPLFLDVYQQRWLKMADTLSAMGYPCLTIDTSTINPQESLELYRDHFRKIS